MDQSGQVAASGAVDSADVVSALMRVLDGRQMQRSPRARGFLAYVVTETLAGRGDRLSERTIARRALERGADFSGRDDASVRVQASRVRKYLEEYYAREGAADPVRITLPRGSYVVEFTSLESRPRTGATVPGVVVAMLTSSGGTTAALVARSLSESLVQQLSAHSHIRVVGPIEESGDAAKAAAAARVASILNGHVGARDGRLTLAVRLLDADSSDVLWSDHEFIDLAALTGFEAEEQWSREIAAKVGDPSGLVIRRELTLEHPGTEPELAARLAFYAYLNEGTLDSMAEASAALDDALDTGNRTAPLLAMRAALANMASVYAVEDRDVELDRAQALAREALVRDSSNVHANLVLSWPLLQRGQVDLAIEIAENAARLAPYQPTYLSTAGTVLIACGEWQRGSELIREALRLHPGLSSQIYSWLAIAHLAEGDYERALAEASLLSAEGGNAWAPLFRAFALAGLGYGEQAQVELARACELRPDIADDPVKLIGELVRLDDEQRSRLAELLRDTSTTMPTQRRASESEATAGSTT